MVTRLSRAAGKGLRGSAGGKENGSVYSVNPAPSLCSVAAMSGLRAISMIRFANFAKGHLGTFMVIDSNDFTCFFLVIWRNFAEKIVKIHSVYFEANTSE